MACARYATKNVAKAPTTVFHSSVADQYRPNISGDTVSQGKTSSGQGASRYILNKTYQVVVLRQSRPNHWKIVGCQGVKVPSLDVFDTDMSLKKRITKKKNPKHVSCESSINTGPILIFARRVMQRPLVVKDALSFEYA